MVRSIRIVSKISRMRPLTKIRAGREMNTGLAQARKRGILEAMKKEYTIGYGTLQ
jgi:hypothetical protein